MCSASTRFLVSLSLSPYFLAFGTADAAIDVARFRTSFPCSKRIETLILPFVGGHVVGGLLNIWQAKFFLPLQ